MKELLEENIEKLHNRVYPDGRYEMVLNFVGHKGNLN